MATTNTWDQVVSAITGVKNRGSFSRTFTPTMSAQSQTGEAGYYSSVYVACNGAGLSGNAGPSQVLSGYTFYNNSLTRQNGAMINVPSGAAFTLTSTDRRKIIFCNAKWITTNSDGTRRICLQCPTTGYYTNTTVITTDAPVQDWLRDFTVVRAQLSNSNILWNGGQSLETNHYTVPANGLYIVAMAAVISFDQEYVDDNYTDRTQARILLNGADISLSYRFSHPGQNIAGGAAMAFSNPFTAPAGWDIFAAVQGNLRQNAPQHLFCIVYEIGR